MRRTDIDDEVIDPDKSTNTSKVYIPGMKIDVYHLQWLCIFVAVLFNTGVIKINAALIGDEMGTDKVSLSIQRT